MEAAPELASGTETHSLCALQLSHLTSDGSEDFGHNQCNVAEARQFKCIESVSLEAKMFKSALGGLPNMKFPPVRITTDFFLSIFL